MLTHYCAYEHLDINYLAKESKDVIVNEHYEVICKMLNGEYLSDKKNKLYCANGQDLC
jgi:hypothetical protein